MERIRKIVVAAFSSWWVFGLIGWGLLISHYPFDTVLPRYAGGG